jgi:hypothetical protein
VTSLLPATITSSTTISGIPNLPTKLVQKIISWKYIDLGELLPEHLQLASTGTAVSSSVVILPESSYNTHRRKKRQIADIATWVQVFSSYMLVLSTKYPEALPELISYQLLIVQHSQKFRYPSWLRYDIDFRTWAAQTGTRTWSQINPQCYALAFTGQGSSSQWCPICFIDGVSTQLIAQISPWPLVLIRSRRQLKAAKAPHALHYAGHSYHPPLSCRQQSVSKWTTACCTISRTATALMVEIANSHTAAPFAKKPATRSLDARINTPHSSYHYNRQCYISYIGCSRCCYHNLSFTFPWLHVNS